MSGYNTAKNKSNLLRHRREVGFLEHIPEESPYIILEKNKPLFFQVSSIWADGCPLTLLLFLIFYFLNFKIFNSYMRSQTWTPKHLSGSSPCTSPKHAASCIRHRLASQFLHDSIHVRMSFSQIIPPSPSPSESKSLLYTSVSLSLSCIQGRDDDSTFKYTMFSANPDTVRK